ncbi:hypothetical protein S40288_09291 [Stachybotrys chartarum IBT 40288]|nr:hypothetical protein S40288_09291 [Stachybotrys chartarum IBT 40288]
MPRPPSSSSGSSELSTPPSGSSKSGDDTHPRKIVRGNQDTDKSSAASKTRNAPTSSNATLGATQSSPRRTRSRRQPSAKAAAAAATAAASKAKVEEPEYPGNETKPLTAGVPLPRGMTWPTHVKGFVGHAVKVDQAKVVYEKHATNMRDKDRRLFIELLAQMPTTWNTTKRAYDHPIVKGYSNDHSYVRLLLLGVVYGWVKMKKSKVYSTAMADYPGWDPADGTIPQNLEPDSEDEEASESEVEEQTQPPRISKKVARKTAPTFKTAQKMERKGYTLSENSPAVHHSGGVSAVREPTYFNNPHYPDNLPQIARDALRAMGSRVGVQRTAGGETRADNYGGRSQESSGRNKRARENEEEEHQSEDEEDEETEDQVEYNEDDYEAEDEDAGVQELEEEKEDQSEEDTNHRTDISFSEPSSRQLSRSRSHQPSRQPSVHTGQTPVNDPTPPSPRGRQTTTPISQYKGSDKPANGTVPTTSPRPSGDASQTRPRLQVQQDLVKAFGTVTEQFRNITRALKQPELFHPGNNSDVAHEARIETLEREVMGGELRLKRIVDRYHRDGINELEKQRKKLLDRMAEHEKKLQKTEERLGSMMTLFQQAGNVIEAGTR